jgi:hypothetical protein
LKFSSSRYVTGILVVFVSNVLMSFSISNTLMTRVQSMILDVNVPNTVVRKSYNQSSTIQEKHHDNDEGGLAAVGTDARCHQRARESRGTESDETML